MHIWSTQTGQLVHSYLGTGGIFEVSGALEQVNWFTTFDVESHKYVNWKTLAALLLSDNVE